MSTRSAAASVAGVVLAAGASTRMGTNKLLLMLDGEPLVRRATRRAVAAGLAPLIVVLGPEPERMRLALSRLACQFVFNAKARSPMSDSLHKAIESLPPDTDAVVVTLADMVNVTADMLSKIAATAQESSAPLIASRYGEILAPPILFRRTLFGELLLSEGEGCGKSVIERHRADALILDWPAEALLDIDTPEEFANL